jgi:hypothetical protein
LKSALHRNTLALLLLIHCPLLHPSNNDVRVEHGVKPMGFTASWTKRSARKRRVKRLVQPLIPELATKGNPTGTVKIEVTISPDGTVERTRVMGGHPVLASEGDGIAEAGGTLRRKKVG